MKLTMLGTGHAEVTACYNACFVLSEDEEFFLIDGGGGNQILKILEDMNIPLARIHNIFVSHAHTDHVLGIVWVIRIISHLIHIGEYCGELRIFCHAELAEGLKQICTVTIAEKFTAYLNNGIRFVVVADGDAQTVLGKRIEFFDTGSAQMKQFGFRIEYEPQKYLLFCGDVPLVPRNNTIAENCRWLLHEAFCRYSQRDMFGPYEKRHCTVKEACEIAQKVNASNVILFHTEDSCLQDRKQSYISEGISYYKGTIWVPDDRETISLTE